MHTRTATQTNVRCMCEQTNTACHPSQSPCSDLVTFGKKALFDLNHAQDIDMILNILGRVLSKTHSFADSLAYMCSQFKLFQVVERQKSEGVCVCLCMYMCAFLLVCMSSGVSESAIFWVAPMRCRTPRHPASTTNEVAKRRSSAPELLCRPR